MKEKQIYDRALSLQEDMIHWRREIHQHPELGVDQPDTAALVSRALREMGLEPKEIGGGIVAMISGGRPGKTILLRADMDALPMQEESGLPFASKVDGAAHTCGHDMHTAMLLGAAQILSEAKGELHGQVKLMFQPGEEVGLGARQMVDAGLLEDPAVDAAMGIHTIIASDIPSGSIALSPGPSLSSSDLFKIEVFGKGCHGSRPEVGIDTVNIMCHIHTMLQTINTREIPQKEAAVLTIGQIAAGDAPNIIPGYGYMTGTIRTFLPEVRALVKRRLVEISESIAKTMGGSAKVTFNSELEPLINDEDLTVEMIGYLKELVGEDRVLPMPSRMASEDFSAVTGRVPSTFMRLSMGSKEQGYIYDGHHPKVVFDEAAMPAGAAAYAYGAFRWLENHCS